MLISCFLHCWQYTAATTLACTSHSYWIAWARCKSLPSLSWGPDADFNTENVWWAPYNLTSAFAYRHQILKTLHMAYQLLFILQTLGGQNISA